MAGGCLTFVSTEEDQITDPEYGPNRIHALMLQGMALVSHRLDLNLLTGRTHTATVTTSP